MIDLYKIEGTGNICSYDIDHPCYNTESTWPSFKEDFSRFKEIILDSVKNKTPNLFLRVADGEFRFLEKRVDGTNIPRRHLSKNINSIDLSVFWDGIKESDYLMTQLYTEWTEDFNRVIDFRKIDFPMEFAYSIISSRWIFKQFPSSIGIIGGSKKIHLIKEMMKREEYRKYLGVEEFVDYIEVPERFSCDDPENLERIIGEGLSKSKADVFIFGVGIAKLAVAHKFKNYKNSVFIDVGCGISALAGTTSLERPYFGEWTNFILDGYDYSGMDRIDYLDTAGRNEIILK